MSVIGTLKYVLHGMPIEVPLLVEYANARTIAFVHRSTATAYGAPVYSHKRCSKAVTNVLLLCICMCYTRYTFLVWYNKYTILFRKSQQYLHQIYYIHLNDSRVFNTEWILEHVERF